ncbi:phytoene/squalene synthase family protein [Sutcliffiella horikoshii]|uniref:phytoene/squalene synthase family protein n=1 Tax=Sutcliffiella horikoshii TaxID=79883 RepID=UPI00203A99CC|nr:phytoene/squalene synthase family protein [Sutcliffiella horikoshii]MCM3616912.1 phytoene/squalene synthase family protein [Sutcliffiella horikoshii]
MTDLMKAYQHCESIIKEHSKTFYKAFVLLPKEKKQAVWAVYAFCRQVDDIVDEGTDPKEELFVFKQSFAEFLDGNLPSTDLMWTALQDVFRKYEMDVQAFHDMVTGQEMDLYKKHYYTEEEVLHYSYHVASTVGLMLLPILAPNNKDALREDAIALGQAMQITNILRDIGEDLERGRIYFPIEKLEQAGYSVAELEMHIVNDKFISVWEDMAEEAEKLYDQAMSSLDLYPLHSRTPVKGAAYLYRAILGSIRKKGYSVFKTKHYVSSEEKREIISQI